jgi:hypothetical protein
MDKFQCRDGCEADSLCKGFSINIYGSPKYCCYWKSFKCESPNSLITDENEKYEWYRVRIDDTEINFNKDGN